MSSETTLTVPIDTQTDQSHFSIVLDGIRYDQNTRISTGKKIEGNPRKRACRYLVARDGTTCQIHDSLCKNEDLLDIYSCDIDHVNGDESDHRLGNLRRAFHNCNSRHAFAQHNSTRTVHTAYPDNDREIDRGGAGPTYADQTKAASAEMARSLEVFPRYRQLSYEILHGKSNLTLELPGCIPSDIAGGLIANEIGKGVAQTYNSYFKQDSLPNGVLIQTERLVPVTRIISGKAKIVNRTALYYECRACYQYWEKQKETSPDSIKQPIDHPPYPSGRGF